MSTDSMKVFIFLIVFVFLAGILIFVLRHAKKGRRADRYDERQIAAQGQGYRLGFYTTLGWSMLYVFTDSLLGIPWCHPYVAHFFGVFLGLTVWGVYCILKDAYVPRDQSQVSILIVLNLNLFSMGSFLINGEHPLVENGVLDSGCVFLLYVLSILSIDTAFFLHRRRARHAEKETAEE